jgi:hypothetical protein
MIRMNGSELGVSGEPDTRRDLQPGCCHLRGQRMGVRSVVQGRERDAQSVVRMCEGPEADAHARQRGQKEWRINQ